jgi:threonine/homoserine/homoserine lactone efflux protein
MIESSSLALFVSAALVLLVVPGPAVMFIVARSLEQGRRAGIYSSLGLFVGGLAHVLAAALGVSAVIAQSAVAFSILKYMGAGYLVFLGIRTLNQKADPESFGRRTARNGLRLVLEGVVVNALNPKAALFFLAFLPQFVDPSAGPVVPQILTLGAIFLALGLATDTLYALLAGSARGLLSGGGRGTSFRRRVSGASYIGLGLITAFSQGTK